jgi:diguanylate cyclase (GGDEF)-like protein
MRDIQTKIRPIATGKQRIANEDGDWWLLRRQLTENARNAKSAVIGNVINAAISTALFWNSVPLIGIVFFLGLIAFQLAWRLSIARRVSRAGRNAAKLGQLRRELIGNAIGLGATWGIIVKSMFYLGGPNELVFAGIIGAGMMSAGMISYRTLQPAALGYIYACMPGAALGLAYDGSAASYSALGLLLCFGGVLTANIRSTAKRFANSTLRERELNRSRNTVRLLLHDHTEQGSDWLVAVDRKGRIIAPSTRFAMAAQRPIEVLDGIRFVDLLDDNEATQTLRRLARGGSPLRNHIVSLTISGEQRWWSISGKAVREENIVYRTVITDITAQRRAEEKVSYMAHYDGLTDLPNRFRFHEHLYHELCRERPIALLFMDLDHFKAVNDTLGHGVGDKLLQAAARRIEHIVGKRAMVARLGGDEFAVLLSGARVSEAQAVAEKIIKGLGESFALGDHDAVVGATIGIAIAPEDGNDPEGLLRNADLALYAAKGQGRNRALRYEPCMDEMAQERRLLEMDMRGALAKGEMCLHYQPLVDANSSEITGYEALVRWVHPTRGIVMPSAFIPIAEETGLIVQLGEWVIRQAIDDMKRWDEHLMVSVNLSPAQMRSPGLISTVVNALAANNVDASRLCLEITETVLMQDSDTNIQVLHKLREIGVQIALDDFGTGYSSLNYLRSFPFSKIKIDRCFVSEIDTREDCRAIIRSVVSLANSLGMSTTAEGVERIEQIEHLRREGCGEVQGFLFSQAVPVEELSNLRPVRNMKTAAISTISEKRSGPADSNRADVSKSTGPDNAKAA